MQTRSLLTALGMAIASSCAAGEPGHVMELRITVDGKQAVARLNDSAAAKELAVMLPLKFKQTLTSDTLSSPASSQATRRV